MARILARDVTQQRRDRTSVKWTLWGPDVLPLWVAEMDAAPCPAVVEAVSSAMAGMRVTAVAPEPMTTTSLPL